MTRRMWGVVCALMLACGTLHGATADGPTGDWKTPDGSVVRVSECSDAFCMTIVKIAPTARGTTDQLNPDAALKGRPLCGARIGQGFRQEGGAATATGGHIYDPLSGKTYNAKLTWKGDTLKLRGFVGVSMFGRTEVWTKTTMVESCR